MVYLLIVACLLTVGCGDDRLFSPGPLPPSQTIRTTVQVCQPDPRIPRVILCE